MGSREYCVGSFNIIYIKNTWLSSLVTTAKQLQPRSSTTTKKVQQVQPRSSTTTKKIQQVQPRSSSNYLNVRTVDVLAGIYNSKYGIEKSDVFGNLLAL